MHLIYKDIIKAYSNFAGKPPDLGEALAHTASNRRYFRLVSGNKPVIACYNPDRAENEAFLYIRERLANAGVRVPEILYVDTDQNIIIQQDLGDTRLLDVIEASREIKAQDYLNWYKKVIDKMPAIQYKTVREFDFSRCYPREAFDRQSVLWDLNYFKYYFLKLNYIPFHEQLLENDFQILAEFLMEADSSFFLFRDFQSRNIMIENDEVAFIDFQGGRRGALQYDLASLLFEARAMLSPDERTLLLDYYLEVFRECSFFNKDSFLKYFPAYCLIRLLQAFGAYGYRGLYEKKTLFLQSIPPAVRNLKWILEKYDLGIELPHLRETLQNLVSTLSSYDVPLSPDTFTISINSFSYRTGIPQDYSGNGGGFVFDCRGLPNPGRFEEFKDKTGLDEEVIDFMREKPEVEEFIGHAATLVLTTVNNYLERNLEHLMVSFGCTGGQHRSVYCAEQLYQILCRESDAGILMNHQKLEVKKNGGKYVPKKEKGKEKGNEKAG